MTAEAEIDDQKLIQYWVSQGKKWCDFCKIFIANNPLSIRTHDLGERHKENVAKRLSSMRKESAAKDKEQKNAARALEQIEEKAKQSYQKDLASFDSRTQQKKPDNVKFSAKDGWEHDAASGYYCNLAKGYYYDPKSGLFYTNEIGKWVTEEEAFKTSQNSGSSSTGSKPKSSNPLRSVKGAPSSIAVNKRKRENEKPKVVSKEEAEALKAREAAKKRVEEREKPLMGLYTAYKF